MSKKGRMWLLAAATAITLAAGVYELLWGGGVTLLGVVLLAGAALQAVGLASGWWADLPSPSRGARAAILVGVAILVVGLVLALL
jgi:hypothetical protein